MENPIVSGVFFEFEAYVCAESVRVRLARENSATETLRNLHGLIRAVIVQNHAVVERGATPTERVG